MEPPYERGADAPTAADSTVTLCFFNGCSQPARPGSVKCAFHRKKGTCVGPACRNQVYARGRCVLHGARKPCTYPDGCDGFARSRGLCSRHSRGGQPNHSDDVSNAPDRSSSMHKSGNYIRHRQPHHPYFASPQQRGALSPAKMLLEVDPKARSCLDGLLQLNQHHHDQDHVYSTMHQMNPSPRTLPPLLPSRAAPCTYTNPTSLPTLPSIRSWLNHPPCIMY
ncbi:hypothetical protein H310_05193 [Aphanomyces invadans]|uniref:Uncharacterized protein n=1 Tax=Aphanomyces invadans TaxID=157072 RepID=A0A024UD85_9STRA|nr:hypothetical protein H310_05193 [Aphanomyces invadans]ETW03837.1 hypothetical protein H310_05193 [Aphanomyces invadans]|eukprot:XP_008868066.1 hypothetical protein H310_05193 [Aphanomyces invadans]